MGLLLVADGVLPPSAHLMVPGGNYWPAYNYGTKFEIAASASPSYIDTFLHAGYGVTLGTENSAGTSHALTCWGYNYNPASSQYYTHLYITDSDDGVEALQTYSIGQDSSGNWIFTDGSLNGWRLTGVEGFEKRSVGEFYATAAFDLIDPNNSEIKEVFKLLPYLSFDYKWDVPHPGDPQEDRFLIQIETSNGNWETLFELFYRPEDQQTGWHSINLAIPKEFQGRHRLLFGVEGGGSVTLYRRDPAAPLPGTVWFVATGLGGLLALRRKNRPKVKAGNSARDPVSSS